MCDPIKILKIFLIIFYLQQLELSSQFLKTSFIEFVNTTFLKSASCLLWWSNVLNFLKIHCFNTLIDAEHWSPFTFMCNNLNIWYNIWKTLQTHLLYFHHIIESKNHINLLVLSTLVLDVKKQKLPTNFFSKFLHK